MFLVKKKKERKKNVWRTSVVRDGRHTASTGDCIKEARERKISGNACRRGKIVRWHLIRPAVPPALMRLIIARLSSFCLVRRKGQAREIAEEGGGDGGKKKERKLR